MTLDQCEKFAQENGFDSLEFIAEFPAGAKKCQWLDAYFGFFKVDGMNSFVSVDSINEMFPDLVVRPIESTGEQA